MKRFILFILSIILLAPVLSYGGADVGEVQVSTPNIMVIFDTSSSMNNRLDGTDQSSGQGTGVDGKQYWFDGGGSHPDSKLYQAKKILKDTIQTVVQDRANLGFSTYNQFKIEKRRGMYTKKQRWWVQERSECTPIYKYRCTVTYTEYYGDSCTIVTLGPQYSIGDKVDGCTIQGVSVDNEHNLYTWRGVTDPYAHTKTRTETEAYDNPPSCLGGSVTRFLYSETCNVVGGYWSDWYDQNRWITYSYYSSDPPKCPDTDGYDCLADDCYGYQYTKWTLIPGTCYDYSDYIYGADGYSKAHTWSYFKIRNDGTWRADDPLTFPSNMNPGVDDKPHNIPGTENNHHFFVNFPDEKDKDFTVAQRTAATDQILSLLDLTPVYNPGTYNYSTKLPIGRGLTANTQESPFTPMADSLKWSYKYFYDYIYNHSGGDPASQPAGQGRVVCRGNYIIFITDGLESCRLVWNGSLNAWVGDYTAAPIESARLLQINVKTFVIGFGTGFGGQEKSLNDIAASGGTGQAYFAKTPEGLNAALGMIFETILSGTYSRSNPVVTKDRGRIYRGFYDLTGAGDWKGGLLAWNLDKSGVLKEQAWDGGGKLAAQSSSSRKVYTWIDDKVNPARIELKSTDSSLYTWVNPANDDINGDGSKNDSDAQAVISYTLDPAYSSGAYRGVRQSDWKLGDIYHSTPVAVGEPAFFYTDASYQNFYNTWKNREKRIYVGANDGMLHAFRDIDGPDAGTEAFSVIPRNLLGNLKSLKDKSHNYYVDSSPKAYDVYFANDTPAKWKTVLITGQMKGGPYYFAVDVTDPNDPKILWEWPRTAEDKAHMGESWGKPDIGKVKVKIGFDEVTKTVAFLTGGYSTLNNVGNSFYVVDIETGTTLKAFTGLGSTTNSIPSGPTAFDAEGNGFVEYVYFGDISGTLWKANLSSINIADWAVSNFFTPTTNDQKKPIFYSPAVTKNDAGDVLIFYGTGDELNLMTSVLNYFWEIKDKGDTGDSNWVKTLSEEKVLAPPVVANYTVYFTTWKIPTSGACGTGEGKLYGVKVSRSTALGGVEALVTLDASGKPKPAQEYISLGLGIPSAPVITNGMIYVSSSVDAKNVTQIPIPTWSKVRVRSWREVF